MLRMKSLVTALDILGAGALLAAALALVNAVGGYAVLPEHEALRLFTLAFITALAAFSTARVCQIGHQMRVHVDPRRARELRALQLEALAPADATPPVPNPFQRAA